MSTHVLVTPLRTLIGETYEVCFGAIWNNTANNELKYKPMLSYKIVESSILLLSLNFK